MMKRVMEDESRPSPLLEHSAVTIRYSNRPSFTETPQLRKPDLHNACEEVEGERGNHMKPGEEGIDADADAAATDAAATIDQVPRWFEGVRLNFAENVLYSRQAADSQDHRSRRHKEDARVANRCPVWFCGDLLSCGEALCR
jgi:hypothetical protein